MTLDEWDEDSEMATLEPTVERAVPALLGGAAASEIVR